MENSQKLTAAQASSISTALISFESLNTKRQLTEELLSQGVTLDKYREWASLDKLTSLGVSIPLMIDIENMLIHVEKGILLKSEELHQVTPYGIKTASKRARDAQQGKLDTQARSLHVHDDVKALEIRRFNQS